MQEKWEYKNVILYSTDIQSMEPGEWLTDTVIDFYFEWLESHHARHYGFLRPALVQLLCHANYSDLESAIPKQDMSKDILFIPINDNQEDQVGGTHWSLAVFYRPSMAFYYYDSLGNSNLRIAQRNCMKLSRWIQPESNIQPMFYQVETPQQVNGFDCGVYVITITELLCQRDWNLFWTKPGDLSMWKCFHLISPGSITQKRHALKTMVGTECKRIL